MATSNSATLRFFSVAEQCHTQNFCLRCFKSDFDAIKKQILSTHRVDWEDDLKGMDDLKIKDNLKNEGDQKREDNIKMIPGVQTGNGIPHDK